MSNVVELNAVKRLLNSPFYQQAKLIAFDFDGVVADTEHYQMHAFKWVADTLSSNRPLDLDFHALAKEMMSKSEKEILTILKDRHDIPNTVEELLTIRSEAYLDSACSQLHPNPHAMEIIEDARSRGIKCIIVSNGRQKVLGTLNAHWGIGHLFDDMQTIDVRTLAKIPYLLSLDINPSEIVFIEDSQATAAAAGQAGMHAVYSKHGLNEYFTPCTGITIPCINGAEEPIRTAKMDTRHQTAALSSRRGAPRPRA